MVELHAALNALLPPATASATASAQQQPSSTSSTTSTSPPPTRSPPSAPKDVVQNNDSLKELKVAELKKMLQERELSTARLSPLFALMPTAYVSSCYDVPSPRRCCRNAASLLRAFRLCLREACKQRRSRASFHRGSRLSPLAPLASVFSPSLPLYCAPLASVCAHAYCVCVLMLLAFIAALASRHGACLHCLSTARLSPLFALMPTA
jgi:hypothetical protein